MNESILMYFMVLLPNMVISGTFSDVVSLYNNLTNGHNTHLRPETDQTLVTQITTKFNLVSLLGIDAVEGTSTVSGYFTMYWTDQNLIWDPTNYGNIDKVTFPIDAIWTPPLVISNSVTTLKMLGMENSYLKVASFGFVYWQPGASVAFSCSIDSSYFPFDTQTCTFNLVVWGFDSSEVQLVRDMSTIDLTSYQENGEWELISTNVIEVNGNLDFEMRFKRRPMFLIISIVLPVMFIALLNILVFILPQDSGERIGLAITSLLSIVVFLTIAQDLLPATALPRLSAICVTLTIDMFMSGAIIVSTVVSSWFYHRPTSKPVPTWMKTLIRSRRLCRRLDNQVEIIVKKENKMKLDEKNSTFDLEDNSEEITWCDVSAFWDKISIVFYTFWFFGSLLAFIIDILVGTS